MKKIQTECSDCGHAFEVTVEEVVPARNMNGRMEDAIPEEGGNIYPSECRECGVELDIEFYLVAAAEMTRDEQEYQEEMRGEMLRERAEDRLFEERREFQDEQG